MKFKYLIFLSAFAVTAPAFAQDEEPAEEDTEPYLPAYIPPETSITVLANGMREPVASTGQAVSVFDRRAMDLLQGPDLTRLLERAPGVAVSRNGGPGNFTAVRVRGAEGEQLLVVIDGVRVADPASPGGGFDFGNLLMGNLAKVELQRSSNSTIWGSQALGGVLVASTGTERTTGSLEYGVNDSFYGAAGTRFSAGALTLGAQAAHYTTDGFSAAAEGTEPDGFRQTELSARAELAVANGLSAFARGRFADGRLEIDGFPAPAFSLADTAEYQVTRQRSGAAGLRFDRGEVEVTATASLADTERDSFDPTFGSAPGYTTDGESERAELRGRWRFLSNHHLSLDFGAEREWQQFSTLFDPVRRTAISGGYLQLDYDRENIHLAAGVRRDDHRDFGGEWSFGADAVYDFDDGFRLHASYGEGFKAPTLFQLHSDFGNIMLQPERGRSYDAGASFDFGPGEVRLTAFRRDTEDLIGFVSCFGVSTGICTNRPFGTYDNIGRARAQGLEAEGNLRFGTFTLAAAYALLDAQDRTPGSATYGNDLARRPRNALTLSADWFNTIGLSVGADLRVVSGSFDDPANLVPIDGYATLGLRGEWMANRWITLFGRVENVWDETYQTAAGYATPGRGAYVGARARW